MPKRFRKSIVCGGRTCDQGFPDKQSDDQSATQPGIGTRPYLAGLGNGLVWQARVAELLGQLRNSLVKADVISNVPHQVRRHLDAAWKISELHGQAVKYELAHLREALEKLGIPVVLLKGAAYCAQNNSAAAGRVFSDIDILVPKAALDEAEQLLLGAGWIPTHLNAYDQRYYRDWMHEIPPIEHKNRSTVLDV